MNRIYMDHSATSPVDPIVLEQMMPFFSEKFGNASSLYSFGREARQSLEESRQKVADLIHAKKEEIIFTSSGTESDNMAIRGIATRNKKYGDHIITSAIEHHAVLNTCKYLEKQGYRVTYLPVGKDGIVDPGDVERAITDKTILITVMHANNEIGTIQPVEEIGRIAESKDIYFHTDAVQTVGKIPVDVEKMKVDLLSISAHKLYGPKGVGALYMKKGTTIDPLLYGGGHERGLRSSTENVAGIVGFGAASELAKKNHEGEMKKLAELRDMLIRGVLPIKESYLNGHPTKRLPNNANFRFSYLEGESLVLTLDMMGIAASTGSACSSASLEPSHVLLAIGLKHEEAHGSLRLTLGKKNTKEEVQRIIEVLPGVVERLRLMSPLAPPGV